MVINLSRIQFPLGHCLTMSPIWDDGTHTFAFPSVYVLSVLYPELEQILVFSLPSQLNYFLHDQGKKKR